MSGALAPRLVLVTRETEYDALLARHATRGQAATFLRRRAQSLEGLETRRTELQAMLAQIRAAAPKGWRIAAVRRAELDRFLFGPEDVVVAVGQDGLVANLAKYLSGQPVIGVNGDPSRNPGILVPHSAATAAAALPLVAVGHLNIEQRTMIRAELDDGQTLLALNEIFVGHASHQSARYSITWAGRVEAQSSSGLIIASGTGATGWALSISRATGASINLQPDEAAAVFLVREPWPSQATGTGITAGRLGATDSLLIVSRMNEGGVVFADGMEGDRLDFAWGRTLRVSVAEQRLHFLPGATSLPAKLRPAIPPRTRPPRGSVPVSTAVATPARQTERPAAPPAPPRRRRTWRLLAYIIGALILLLWIINLLGSPPPLNPAAEPPPTPSQDGSN